MSGLASSLSISLDPNFATLAGVKLTEGELKCFALSQDSDPTQTALHRFENEHLEQAIVFVERDAPLLVMIGNVKRILARPRAAFNLHRFLSSIRCPFPEIACFSADSDARTRG